MATNAKINTYATGDVDLTNIMMVLDRTRVGFMQVSLTEMDTTTIPKVAAGSLLEVSGALYSITADESISTMDPVTATTVVDGTCYIVAIPDGNNITFALTATAPTWSDAKQGWYGTGDFAACRYVGRCTKSTSSYTSKAVLKNFYAINPQVEFEKVEVLARISIDPLGTSATKVSVVNSKTIDTHSAFSDSGTFTTPVGGLYRISLLDIFLSYGSACIMFSLNIYKNGSSVRTHYTNTPSSQSSAVYADAKDFIDILSLNVGDSIEIYGSTTNSAYDQLIIGKLYIELLRII